MSRGLWQQLNLRRWRISRVLPGTLLDSSSFDLEVDCVCLVDQGLSSRLSISRSEGAAAPDRTPSRRGWCATIAAASERGSETARPNRDRAPSPRCFGRDQAGYPTRRASRGRLVSFREGRELGVRARRLAAVFTVALASPAITALATPKASSSPCQALWVWAPSDQSVLASAACATGNPLWARQDKTPVWDPGPRQWGIWIGTSWLPL